MVCMAWTWAGAFALAGATAPVLSAPCALANALANAVPGVAVAVPAAVELEAPAAEVAGVGLTTPCSQAMIWPIRPAATSKLIPPGVRRRVMKLESSLAAPDWRALLGKRRSSLAGVLRGVHGLGDLLLAGEELRLGPIDGLDDDPLGRGQRQRAVGGDRGGELERLIHGLPGLGQAVEETELVRALGGDRIAGEGELERDRARQHPRQAQ